MSEIKEDNVSDISEERTKSGILAKLAYIRKVQRRPLELRRAVDELVQYLADRIISTNGGFEKEDELIKYAIENINSDIIARVFMKRMVIELRQKEERKIEIRKLCWRIAGIAFVVLMGVALVLEVKTCLEDPPKETPASKTRTPVIEGFTGMP